MRMPDSSSAPEQATRKRLASSCAGTSERRMPSRWPSCKTQWMPRRRPRTPSSLRSRNSMTAGIRLGSRVGCCGSCVIGRSTFAKQEGCGGAESAPWTQRTSRHRQSAVRSTTPWASKRKAVCWAPWRCSPRSSARWSCSMIWRAGRTARSALPSVCPRGCRASTYFRLDACCATCLGRRGMKGGRGE